MKNIKILDCTLRDGGRIIECKFADNLISEVTQELTDANIDIIEIGFLRDKNLIEYQGDSTFFTEISQMNTFIPTNKRNSIYTAFIDFDMYDFSCLEKCDGNSITGIRVGFTKNQFLYKYNELKKSFLKVKEQGYKLFIQGVNTLCYSDKELLDLLNLVNEIEPYSFGIVDTYGGMYLDDIVYLYNFVDHNLKSDICIDIHSHNNLQLSFALAQEVVRMSNEKRQIILDATLNGMGKCAGNLNTELIVDFLIRKKNYDYDMDVIFDVIDRYIYPIKNTNEWGYSIPAFFAGIYKAHPNNIIYLNEKYKLKLKDLKYIISGIKEEKRLRYDYENIHNVYENYCLSKINDSQAIDSLRNGLKGKHVLIIEQNKSSEEFHEKICDFIEKENPVVISLNFIHPQIKCDYMFFDNSIQWGKNSEFVDRSKCILVSNIYKDTKNALIINYSGLIMEESFLYNNSMIMLLNLLKKVDVSRISLVGFFDLKEIEGNYINPLKNLLMSQQKHFDIAKINKEAKKLFDNYKKKVSGKIVIDLLINNEHA